MVHPGASDSDAGEGIPAVVQDVPDDSPETDPEFEAAIARGRASFAQSASCWFYSQRIFNDRESSRLRYERYRDRMYRAFEGAYGEVADSLYCRNAASAAALTRTRQNRWSIRGRRSEEELSLHLLDNLPDGANRDADAMAATDLLSQCDALASRAGEDLTGAEQYRCIEDIYGCVTDLLGIYDEAAARLSPERFAIEGSKPSDPLKRESQLIKLARKRLAEIANYYDRMAQRRAQVVYFGGMVIGVVAVAVLVSVGWWAIDSGSRAIVEGCLAAGAVGAVMSVLSRVTFERFKVAYDTGRRYIRLSGTSRPVVGAVFGLLFYFALEGGWIPLETPTDSDAEFAFFVVGAFVAGYGERLAQDLLGQARSRLTASGVTTPPPRAIAAAEEPEVTAD